ncbi:MAG: PorV/PorQ family protein, partial [Bacteroidia bacterium]
MKRLALFLLLIIPTFSSGQYGYDFLNEYFFARQPSARAEAMGRSYVSIDGDLSTAFFNPAGVATIQGLELSGSYASPYYSAKDANYGFVSVGYTFNDYLTIAVNRNQFSFGKDLIFTDDQGNILGTYRPYETNYCLTIASQPIKNLFLGLNTNYFIWRPLDKQTAALYFDFGAIKKFEFAQKAASGHSVNLGASIVNFNYGKITLDVGNTRPQSLPVITRFGANYQFTLNKHFLIDTLKTFKFLVQGEFQDVLNSGVETAFRTGGEITLLEILSIRAGYYKETKSDYAHPDINYGEISALTYGFGLQIPFYKLTKVPLNINFDYTSLPQPLYSTIS